MAGTPLTDAIEALTTYANTVTSASDTTLSDAVATLAAGYGGGGSSNEDAILNRSITTLTNNTITTLGNFALSQCTSLTSLTLGSVTSVGNNALDGCTGITALSDANFPSLSGKIGSTAFGNMTNLETVNFTGTVDFYNNTYAFRGCSKLVTAMFPNAVTTQNNGSTQRTFYNCTKLQTCDLGKVNGIGINTFDGCAALRTLILRKTGTATTLGAYSAAYLKGIYEHPTESTIYVPQALISTYQTATNWSSAYSAGVTFAKIEGSIYEL